MNSLSQVWPFFPFSYVLFRGRLVGPARQPSVNTYNSAFQREVRRLKALGETTFMDVTEDARMLSRLAHGTFLSRLEATSRANSQRRNQPENAEDRYFLARVKR